MTNSIQPVRGMNDVLPAEIGAWQHLERVARGVFEAYGYEEVRVPIVEHTELFKRSIGEYTDIVEKEMYTFQDTGGDSLTLRPEATAGSRGQRSPTACCAVRATSCGAAGPMFRHERPQKGRYRQFYQFDVEALGFAGPGYRCRTDRAECAAVARAEAHARAPDDQLAGHASRARDLPRAAWSAVLPRPRERPR